MTDDIFTLCSNAASMVKKLDSTRPLRVVSHYDADGISAAGIICSAVYQEGFNFHASLMRNPFDKGFKRIAEEENDLIIFSDMGSGQIESIENLKTNCIILDHHQYLRASKSKDIIQINANNCGINGNYEACGATLAYAFAKALNKNNLELAPLALTGAIGDKQHIGGLRGFNKKILDEALQNNLLTTRIGSKLYGKNIFDALNYSIDPYYKGLSGNDKEIKKLLDQLKLKPEKLTKELDTNITKKLNSLLLLRLIDANIDQRIIDIVFRTRYYSEKLGCELERLADLLDACGKNGARGLGLSICFGNENDFSEAESIEKDYKTKILHALQNIEKGDLQQTTSFQYFYNDSSSLGGVVAGIAMNYVVSTSKPLLSLAQKDDELHISCRGTQQLVEQGLDLGQAMKSIATELKGFGGGHKIAAGATISLDKETDFISKTTDIIKKQVRSK